MKALVICCIVIAACFAESCSARGPAPPPPLEVHIGEFISARRCGDCHTEIYQVWASSLHATSLTNATFPYLLELANFGLGTACQRHRPLLEGVNTYKGWVTHRGVAESQNREWRAMAAVE